VRRSPRWGIWTGASSLTRLGRELQKIATKYDIEIARLNTEPKNVVAVPFEEQRVVNEYGMRRAVQIKRLRVTVQFTGEPDTLKLMPSCFRMISSAVDVDQRSISFTIPDDERADREVADICETIQGNLDQLRQDYQQYKPQLEKTVSQAAERRKAEIAAEVQRDRQHRAFTVRRG
jgi:hypothetical protein